MSPSALFLWLNVIPAAAVAGVGAAWGAYWLAHPRPTARCGGVLAEAWRVYAFVGAGAGFYLGAVVYLWLRFDWRPPVLLSGVPGAVALFLIALAPVPAVVAACNRPSGSRVAGHSWLASLALAGGGVGLLLISNLLRESAWQDLSEHSVGDAEALHSVTRLESLRLVPFADAADVVDGSRPDAAGLLDLVAAYETGETQMDNRMRVHVADRLLARLAADDGDDAAVSAVWSLTADRERLDRAYGLAHPQAARPDPLAIESTEAAVRDTAATNGAATAALLEALDSVVGRQPLHAETVTALASLLRNDSAPDSPDRVSWLAFRILFRNGSADSLKAVLPRFARADDPAWELLYTDCPKSTRELASLSNDPQTEVAAGALAVLSWVRQFCVSSSPVGR